MFAEYNMNGTQICLLTTKHQELCEKEDSQR